MKLLVKRIKSKFATPLPVGMAEFKTWSAEIIELSGKFADDESLRFALADMILRIGTIKNSKYQTLPGSVPKDYFVQALRKIASSQIASAVLQEIKTNQEAKQKQQAEETAALEATSSDGKTNTQN